MRKFTRTGLLLLPALLSLPAFGQMDFEGAWAPLFHEDLPERIPGPELGDYMGFPINAAARLRGGQLRRRPHFGGAGIPVPAARRRLFHARAVQHAHRRDSRSGHAAAGRLAHAHELSGNGADHLDGRPPASGRFRSAHLAGLLDGHLARQHAERVHHASEGKLPAPQRPAAQRQSRPSPSTGFAMEIT